MRGRPLEPLYPRLPSRRYSLKCSFIPAAISSSVHPLFTSSRSPASNLISLVPGRRGLYPPNHGVSSPTRCCVPFNLSVYPPHLQGLTLVDFGGPTEPSRPPQPPKTLGLGDWEEGRHHLSINCKLLPRSPTIDNSFFRLRLRLRPRPSHHILSLSFSSIVHLFHDPQHSFYSTQTQ